MSSAVNGQRRYDASTRRAEADKNRERIVREARRLFLSGGYGPTTVAAIAGQAGVSAELVYKTFGGKVGLVRAIHERSLLGIGDVSAEQRSDQAQAEDADARVLLARFGRFVTEVSPLVAPVMRLIRDAAAGGDAGMLALLEQVETARHERMLHNARTLVARGLCAVGMTPERAADVMWFYTAPEIFESLVLKRNWPLSDFGDFVGNALAAALLD